jgi:hypothetical protein
MRSLTADEPIRVDVLNGGAKRFERLGVAIQLAAFKVLALCGFFGLLLSYSPAC